MTLPRDTDAPAPGAMLGDDTTAALQNALAAEHAALWMYGLVAAHAPQQADTVAAAITSHQGTRDAAANMIVVGGGTPVGPEPAYVSPQPATDKASALQLAIVIEQDCASAWRAVVGFTDDSTLRGSALSALTECSMRMVTWRKAAGIDVVTDAFPGDPQR